MKILHPRDGINLKYVAYFMSVTRLVGNTHKRYWISEYSKIMMHDLPYSSQLIPLAAIFAYDNEKKDKRAFILGHNKELLAQWYWCGVMGELY